MFVFGHQVEGGQIADGGEDGAGEASVLQLVAVSGFPIGEIFRMT
ncbi:MAG: hypothetical protein Q7J07_10410 [Pelolinea sp.]|nr:hypothetical protein [Pelolinea sp.]